MHSPVEDLGDQLRALIEGAKSEIFLAAPFIKARTLTRLIEVARPGVSGTIVTRWRPEEVASGVSDLEVLDLISERIGWRLLLCHRLHAKYYRVDHQAYVGSANLTDMALGWRSPSNLELLVPLHDSTGAVGQLEAQLRRESISATPEIQEAVAQAAACFSDRFPLAAVGHAFESDPPEGSAADGLNFATWLPLARNPADIAYAARNGVSELSSAAAEQVAGDYIALEIPRHVPSDIIEIFVRARLSQHPFVIELNAFASQQRRFGEVSAFVQRWLRENRISRDADEAWQTLMRWLLYFFPEKYERSQRRFSELFRFK